jgi:hypothetical protein
VVDERAVAEAIVLRAMARLVIAEPSFRSATRDPRIGRSAASATHALSG